eukprot:CAMPEP_0178451806 /NCGR_PEP_ID=MMETSP0689_2-20121128/43891_1 /TAXON_ID=160604 /ORGANISM="Amphidinium massartii, Strain CS-259" /LENGTH=108 /DNA_ID=CAMNT_0020077437 /DNA_START=62 /DNA_END=385 /DNA_ORIENTATION=+
MDSLLEVQAILRNDFNRNAPHQYEHLQAAASDLVGRARNDIIVLRLSGAEVRIPFPQDEAVTAETVREALRQRQDDLNNSTVQLTLLDKDRNELQPADIVAPPGSASK